MSDNDPNFCIRCGGPLQSAEIDTRVRRLCPACGWVHYPQLKVGVGAIVQRDESILLLRRATPPFHGMWNLPAGYVEEDESPVNALIREVLEETTLVVKVESIAGAYYFDDDPRGNGVLLTFLCSSKSTDPRPSDEATEPTFFTRETIPRDLAGGGHDRAIGAWRGGESPHNKSMQPINRVAREG